MFIENVSRKEANKLNFKLQTSSTPKQCPDNQQLNVKFSDQEVDTNGGLQADSTVSRIVVRSCLDSLPKLKLETFDGNPIH